jgi:capsular polysaccharide export protein
MSDGILRLPFFSEMLGVRARPVRILTPSIGLTAVAGWGCRPSSRKALSYAKLNDLPYVALEDGFLRSYGTGERFPPLSMLMDQIGIYYNSTHHSALEVLLDSSDDLLSGHVGLVDWSLLMLLEMGLSKYNHAADLRDGFFCDLALSTLVITSCNDILVKRILVVDQTLGDMSVSLGGASAQTFITMLDAAKAENPGATVFVKTHPEVSSGRKGGYLTQVQPDDRTVLLRDVVNPMSLIGHMDKVYVVTSTMGFEALLAGKPVVCFGVPWYAGWGVTDDRCKDSSAWDRRSRQRSVRELFAAAYIHYTRYLNPVTRQRGTILDMINWLVHQKEMATFMHGDQREGRVFGVGFRRWKAANLKPMFGLHSELVNFVPNASGLEKLLPLPGETLVCWGASPPSEVIVFALEKQLKLLHLEDGFIRSVGLGSDLIRPQSLVLDERGIYFDATRPSDLEVMLNSHAFTDDDLSRATWVQQFIINHDITKYNLEPREVIDWRPLANGRSIILVPGQVEDDASIQLGCTTIKTNLHLLKAVRETNPDSYIIYKPHPDVLNGNRNGRVALEAAHQWADHIEAGTSVVSCIAACDEVHTMTSLAGFDALLRGKKVVTYGQPFYAGWGLTEDRAEHATAFERRKRKLALSQLIAGALIHYPVYWDWDLKGYTTCEAVLHRIVEERTKLEASGTLDQLRVGWIRRQYRKSKVVLSGFIH